MDVGITYQWYPNRPARSSNSTPPRCWRTHRDYRSRRRPRHSRSWLRRRSLRSWGWRSRCRRLRGRGESSVGGAEESAGGWGHRVDGRGEGGGGRQNRIGRKREWGWEWEWETYNGTAEDGACCHFGWCGDVVSEVIAISPRRCSASRTSRE